MSEETTATDEAAATETAPTPAPKNAPKAKKRNAPKKPPALKVAKSGEILRVPIMGIAYDNPRHEPESLYEEGFILIGDPKNVSFECDAESGDWVLEQDGKEPKVVEDPYDEKNFVSLAHMATSEDIDQARRFVSLIEEFENVNKDNPNAPQSIVELATDIRTYSQMYPILVRKNGRTGFTGIDGGRRMAAILYLHAKSRVLKADKETDPVFGEKTPKDVYEASVLVTEQDCKASEVKLRSLVANLSRKEFTVLQEGRVYHDMLQEINPETGKKFTSKDAAAFLGVQAGTFRNREALWREPSYDDAGKQTKGLTDAQREKVAAGEMLATAASRKALGEKHYSETGKPSTKRNKGVPLSKMHDLFDETAEGNAERRQAIADCMGIPVKQAIKESEKRIADAEERELAAA
jgi:hypothetical protein